MSAPRWSVVTGGLWMMVLGVLFLFHTIGVVELRPSILWPVLLIAWGTSLLAYAYADE